MSAFIEVKKSFKASLSSVFVTGLFQRWSVFVSRVESAEPFNWLWQLGLLQRWYLITDSCKYIVSRRCLLTGHRCGILSWETVWREQLASWRFSRSLLFCKMIYLQRRTVLRKSDWPPKNDNWPVYWYSVKRRLTVKPISISGALVTSVRSLRSTPQLLPFEIPKSSRQLMLIESVVDSDTLFSFIRTFS